MARSSMQLVSYPRKTGRFFIEFLRTSQSKRILTHRSNPFLCAQFNSLGDQYGDTQCRVQAHLFTIKQIESSITGKKAAHIINTRPKDGKNRIMSQIKINVASVRLSNCIAKQGKNKSQKSAVLLYCTFNR